jgi:hypothetical protein
MILVPLSIEKCILGWWFGATFIPSDLVYSTKFNVYFEVSFAVVISEPVLYRHSTYKVCVHFPKLRSFIEKLRPNPRPFVAFCN